MNKEKSTKKEILQIKDRKVMCKFITGLSHKSVNIF
jgi:hypothetical protein